MLVNSIYVAGLYLRLSEKDKKKAEENRKNGISDESHSITNQRSLLMQYINENNYKLGDIYIDDGYSGSNFNRPEYRRLIKDIEDGKINMVITKDMSRLGRDYIEVGNLMEKYFPSKNVRYIAIDDNIDTLLDNNNDFTPFKSLLNDLYARDISKKAKSSVRTRQKAGKYISGKGLIGYDIDKKNKYHLVINKKEAKVVKDIFNMCIKGYSLCKIARTLTDNKIPTPAQFKKFNIANYNYNFGIWNSKSIKDILQNEMYLGHMVQNKRTTINHKLKKMKKVDRKDWIIVKNTHQAIIDEEIFNKVQKLIQKNSIRSDKKENHLFDGLLYCYECGHKISVQPRRKVDNNCYTICNYYRSTNGRICMTHINNYDKLEKALINEIKIHCESYINKDNISKNVIKMYYKELKKNDYKVRIKRIKDEIKSLNNNLDQIYFDKLSNEIDEEMYKRIKTKILDIINTKEKELINLEKVMMNNKNKFDSEKTLKKIIDEYLLNIYNIKEVILNLIDKVVIHQDKHVDIYFAFKKLN